MKDSVMKQNKSFVPLISIILFCDLAIIILYMFIVLPALTENPHTLWSLIDLDQEANLTAWYSSAKLLGLAIISFMIFISEGRSPGSGAKSKWMWLVVAIIFLALSADETASIHETIADTIMKGAPIGVDIRESVLGGDKYKDSFAWVVLLAPFILAVSVFFLIFFYKKFSKSRTNLIISVIALGCYLLAVGSEATIYLAPAFTDFTAADTLRYRISIGIEESGEIIGTTLFLLVFLRYRLSLD